VREREREGLRVGFTTRPGARGVGGVQAGWTGQVASSLLYTVHRLHAEYSARKLRIHSFCGYPLESGGIVDHDDHDHSPESCLDFRRAMRWLSPDGRRGVFLDCGSGKGRIVLAAACHTFRRVIGVEISPALNRVAERDLESARPRLRCRDVEFVTVDAGTYEFPDDVTCVFIYNPFREAVLAAVIENLRRSLARAPRALSLIASTPDRFEEALAGAGWIAKTDEFHGLRRHVLFRTT
jgi:SAM-dependent methyltransferase